MNEELLLERPAEGVALITLNRPAVRNAITTTLQRHLGAMLRLLKTDREVRAIVITGAGEKAFSAGYDVKELESYDEDRMLVNYVERQNLMGEVAFYSKPMVGAINGVAHGGGAILASVLDIRVGCSRTDFRFTAAAYAGVNNTWQLPQIVGHAKALEFTMTSRRIGADESLQAGLLNHVVADDQVLAKSIEIASLIASNPAAAVCGHKAMIQANVGRSYPDAYAAENALMNGPLRPGRPGKLFEAFLAEHPQR
ncbi:MAG: crotonase [Hydrocarboniphaga sp.]|uniref:enoyl-CoA hydratase/isomerase family protein n=1 Tax=Hydrocarboniphaga sp. TaxID=2033016 RepID=UPI00262AD70C|nr:enoyl-CoA hydratase/isomerase family protein [Hydrocarboniphaga sp.]MDB5970166.1 crotonase [Hydrocarboniphaga sp.]